MDEYIEDDINERVIREVEVDKVGSGLIRMKTPLDSGTLAQLANNMDMDDELRYTPQAHVEHDINYSNTADLRDFKFRLNSIKRNDMKKGPLS